MFLVNTYTSRWSIITLFIEKQCQQQCVVRGLWRNTKKQDRTFEHRNQEFSRIRILIDQLWVSWVSNDTFDRGWSLVTLVAKLSGSSKFPRENLDESLKLLLFSFNISADFYSRLCSFRFREERGSNGAPNPSTSHIVTRRLLHVRRASNVSTSRKERDDAVLMRARATGLCSKIVSFDRRRNERTQIAFELIFDKVLEKTSSSCNYGKLDPCLLVKNISLAPYCHCDRERWKRRNETSVKWNLRETNASRR